jgi:hypothetical protein
MNKLTIITENENSKTTFIKEGGLDTLPKYLEAIEDSLRASGFCFKGYLTLIRDEE